MTVNAAPLTITASPQSKTYGSTLSLGTTAFTTATLYNGDTVTGVTLTSSGTAATAPVAGSPYTVTPSAATGSGLANYTITYDTGLLTVDPAPVVLGLQSNVVWLLAGQELSVTAVASTTAPGGGTPPTPDGTVTFYDNGVAIDSQPLAVVGVQDQAVFDTTVLPSGRQLITAGYTSSSGNFAMTAASPVLTEIVFAADASVLTVTSTSSDPTVAGSLPWAVAQADAGNAAAVISFATDAGQAFATPQTITLEAPLDLSDANSVAIEGPAWGVTLVGDYSESRFPVLSVAQATNLLIQGVNIGTQAPEAKGDLQVAGVLDVLGTVANLGSAVGLASGGTADLGGQTVTADSLTLTSGKLNNGTLSSGTRTVFSGAVGANLTGSGGLIKEGAGSVLLSGNNHYAGGTTVLGGTLTMNSSTALPAGGALTVGAGGAFIFDPSASASPMATTSVSDTSATTAVPSSTSSASSSLVSVTPVAAGVSASGSVATPSAAIGPRARNVGKSVVAGALGTWSSIAKRPSPPAPLPKGERSYAGDLAWLGQTANSSDNSNQQRKRDVAILALDAVFAQYGQ